MAGVLRRGLQRTLSARVGPRAALAQTAAPLTRGGGHHDEHHGPQLYDPPMHRLPLPNRPLFEQDEVIWNDGVAPETALDFDAPELSSGVALGMWLGGLGFFYGLYQLMKLYNHPKNKSTVERDLPESTKTVALGSRPNTIW